MTVKLNDEVTNPINEDIFILLDKIIINLETEKYTSTHFNLITDKIKLVQEMINFKSAETGILTNLSKINDWNRKQDINNLAKSEDMNDVLLLLEQITKNHLK